MSAAIQWIVVVYMFMALGVPLGGITIIYFYIVRFTRRVHGHAFSFQTPLAITKRDLRVLHHMMTLVGILGTAGVPGMILIIWNLFVPQAAPIPLYLISILNISFCTNIQITFIFAMNKPVKDHLWLKLHHLCHQFF